jgi:methylthioxylose transferase
MRSVIARLLWCLSSLLVVGFVWATRIPLGIPGEWEWPRIDTALPAFITLFVPLLCALGYFGFVWAGARRIEHCRARERITWLVGLTALGFVWLSVVQEAAPEGYQFSKSAWVLYYRGSSGYYSEARADRRPLGEFLADYERRMKEGDVLHLGTHPPGLIVFFRGLLSLCADRPSLVKAIRATESNSASAAFDEIQKHEQLSELPLHPAGRATLWLAALLAQGLAAATVVPLFGLLCLEVGRRASWLAVSFWPTVPAVAIFLPKSDAAFAGLAALLLWLSQSGWRSGSIWRCGVAGLTLFLVLNLSLAFLPIAMIAALAAGLWFWWSFAPCERAIQIRKRIGALGGAALGFALSVVALWIAAGINLPGVWLVNLENHAGFYAAYPRTWWKWLIANPIELSVAAGVPLVVLAVIGARTRWFSGRLADRGPLMAVTITWGLLWISGKNMGEAARLWILLMPCLVWIAAPYFCLPVENHPRAPASAGAPARFWLVPLAAQMVVCAAIVTRVVGFHYP